MTMPAEKPLGLNHGGGENRRASKPLIEKRRRARINQSLAALKAIVVDSRKDTQSQNARPPKLEKADILEMTVTHLRKLHECMEYSPASENEAVSYRAGFYKCIQTIRDFIQNESSLSVGQKNRLLSHMCSASPSSVHPSESIGVPMDDTASSYSGSSRSNTPSSAANDPTSMEYVPCSPPLSDSFHERSSNSSSPPSSYRTKFYRNYSTGSLPSNYHLCNKNSSREPSSTAVGRQDPEPTHYTNKPLNLASGPRNTERSELYCSQNASRNIVDARLIVQKENSEPHRFFDNRIVENDALMQMDPVWRPW